MQTATNPQNGQTVILVGNEWKPVANVATNKEGLKAYLVDNEWVSDQTLPAKTESTQNKAAAVLGYILGQSPQGRAALGASTVLTSPFQFGANVGEKLGDVASWISEKTGIKGSLGKTQFIPMSSVPEEKRQEIYDQGMKSHGERLVEPSAEFINEPLAQIEIGKRLGMASKSGRPVGEEWDVAGGIGAIVPGTAVYKGIAQALPKALSEGGKTLTGRTIGRMLAGGGTAATTIPDISGGEDYFTNKAVQTGIGAAVPVGMATLGSILKGTGKIIGQSVKSLKDTLRNFTGSGQKVLAEQHLLGLANEGGEPALKKTINSLLNEKRIIGKVTSSEAIASGNIGKGERFGGPIVRLQSELANLPETTTKLRSIEAAQEQIRKAALKSIARGQTEEAVLAERAAASTRNYGKAFKDVVKPDEELRALMSRPSMDNVLRRAQELAKEQGKNFKQGSKYPVESLHFMKMAMDDLIKNPERFGIGASEVRAISQTQNQFVKWIGQKSPAYNFARQEHKKLSEVLNRVQVRDTLEKILTGPRGEERTAQFLNATREIPKTFKKATGSNRFEKMEDILPTHEAKIVNKVVKELERDAMATKMSREVNIPGATSPVTGNMAQLPSPLYRPTMVANWILKRGGEEGNKNVNRIAAEILENPTRAAEVLSKVPPKWKQDVTKALQDFQRFAQDPANVAAVQATGEMNGR